MRRIVLLDLDGTIVDSFDGVRAGIEKALLSLGCPIPQELYEVKNVGQLLPIVQGKLYQNMDYEVFKKEYDSQLMASPLFGVRVKDKTYDILSELSKKYDLIVVTNKNQEVANEICKELFCENAFLHIIGRKNLQAIKPNRQLMEILQQYGVAIQDICCLIGDTDEDVKTADMLGIKYLDIKQIDKFINER